MTDYLNKYSKKVSKHQQGGAAPSMENGAADQKADATQQGAGGNDINAALMQAYQSQDPQMALQVVNMIVEAMQSSQQAGAAPGGGSEMPAARNGMRLKKPVFRKGGIFKA